MKYSRLSETLAVKLDAVTCGARQILAITDDEFVEMGEAGYFENGCDFIEWGGKVVRISEENRIFLEREEKPVRKYRKEIEDAAKRQGLVLKRVGPSSVRSKASVSKNGKVIAIVPSNSIGVWLKGYEAAKG